MPQLLDELRAHLVTAGVVRVPRTAGSAPPMFLSPKNGTPAPGESESGNSVEQGDPVVGAYRTDGIAGGPYVSKWRRKPIVELRFRASKVSAIEQLELNITGKIADRRDFQMAGQYVIECQQWRELQLIESGAQGYEYLASYWFELLRI